MKRILFALMAFCALGVISCRKSSIDESIQKFDADQIQAYIKQSGLTGMTRDTSGGDTTGIYYQVITPGTGAIVKDTSRVSFVYTAKTFDGSYTSTDTILNHTNNFLAYIAPAGVRLGILNIIKRTGGKIRLLIPSRLAYGLGGNTLYSYETDGKTVTSTPHAIAGNQSMDYTIELVSSRTPGHNPNYQAIYDDLSIQKYLAANNLSGFIKDTIKADIYKNTPAYRSVFYYKVTQAGTGTLAINNNSTVNMTYTGSLFDGTTIAQDNSAGVGVTFYSLYNVPFIGWQQALTHVNAGGKITFILPSALGGGDSPTTSPLTGYSLAPFSCLRFDINVLTVIN